MGELGRPDPEVHEIPQEEISDAEVQNNQILLLLSALLEKTQVVNAMNLSFFGFTAEGCKYLSAALKRNSSLEVLQISVNRIYDKGVQELAPLLECNSTLKELYLQACAITDAGLKFLFESLTNNNTLEVLDISANPGITTQGVSVMRDFLCHSDNTALSKIYVSNGILTSLIPASDIIDKVRTERNLHIVHFIGKSLYKYLYLCMACSLHNIHLATMHLL